ncbi:MAG: hypothetical protein ACLPV8_13430 [Steroidobacteraceae bacterium]
MKIGFTKLSGKYDVMEIVRPGKPPERVNCPKQRIIPHDMVHYAIEHTLKARGFLGRVKSGEASSFQMAQESESDSVERLVEVFQGDEWSGGTSSASGIIEIYQLTCAARLCPALPIDDSAVQAIKATIADLTRRWEDIAVGGSLQLEL